MRKIKNDRSIVPYLLLGFLTFGIYSFWYLHHLVKDVNELCKDTGKKSTGVGLYILFGLLTCGLYTFFWWFRLADMLACTAKRRNVETNVSGSYVLICMILGSLMCGIASWVGIHQVFTATNDLATDYNSRQVTAEAPFTENPAE